MSIWKFVLVLDFWFLICPKNKRRYEKIRPNLLWFEDYGLLGTDFFYLKKNHKNIQLLDPKVSAQPHLNQFV